ncbi:DUF2959 family protein [Arenicella xantha]|uniref:DUF2959 family protein n=1 Tax=Arenicella xantha TaxID=644221 RepID=A0A395JIW5_9GAMM|nr:DUF2959 family protein [Arenicella xantha]RBP48571.1 DUF2959 family protein [Arenicella xantha]
MPLLVCPPPIFISKFIASYKLWGSLLVSILLVYQAFSTTGIGSKWGIPSYDTFYQAPRDVLISRIEQASAAQQDTAEEFRTALDKFKSVTAFNGGDLEKQFNTLNDAFKNSEAAAQDVSARVETVVTATNRLLSEWRDELNDYHDPQFKQKAQQQFDQTRRQSEQLIAAMRATQAKTEPVLGAFRDQVLFIKHNLNMQAIGSLKQESATIETDVDLLIKEMEASVAQAETFVRALSD